MFLRTVLCVKNQNFCCAAAIFPVTRSLLASSVFYLLSLAETVITTCMFTSFVCFHCYTDLSQVFKCSNCGIF
jgi:hypothetical protein